MTAPARTLADRTWLLKLAGPEVYDQIQRIDPAGFSDAKVARLEAMLADLERDVPTWTAIRDTPFDDRPAIVERIADAVAGHTSVPAARIREALDGAR